MPVFQCCLACVKLLQLRQLFFANIQHIVRHLARKCCCNCADFAWFMALWKTAFAFFFQMCCSIYSLWIKCENKQKQHGYQCKLSYELIVLKAGSGPLAGLNSTVGFSTMSIYALWVRCVFERMDHPVYV